MRSKILLVVFALVAAFAAAPFQTAAQTTPKTLAIGVISGRNSQTSFGIQLAVARFNGRGNTVTPDGTNYKLAVEERDANSPTEVAAAISELKTKGVLAIFGPDIDELAQASQNTLLAAGLPVFTAATSPDVQTTGSVFRTRATDTRHMAALAQYLSGDLGKTKIAVFQGDSFAAKRVTLFTISLTQLNKTPATTVLHVQGGAMKDSARVLLASTPDMVVAFGSADQASQLWRELKSQGYTGRFAYPDANERAFITSLPPELRPGIYGVTNWTYSVPTGVSGEFVRDYVALFGEPPTGKSAAAYDAAGAVFISATRGGLAADAVIKTLLSFPKQDSIQGRYNAALGTNELSADSYVFETGEFGAPVVKARFDDTGKSVISAGGFAPLPTLAPPATAVPPTVALPPTPEGVTVQPKSGVLNVRAGPGTNYDRIGQLRQSDVVQVIGVGPNLDWLVINFAGGRGWVQASLTNVNGNLQSVPIILPPPSPTPIPATLTPTAQPIADVVPISVVLNPPQPKVGQAFVASVVIQNRGGAPAGQFAVAASWNPGNVYSAATVESLAAGAITTINLNVSPGVTGAGTFSIEVVVDLNNQVAEGNGEGNNKFPISYTVIP